MADPKDPTVRADRAHGEWPVHVDVTVPIDNLPMAHKVRIGDEGRVLSDELTFPNDMGKLTR